MCSSFQQWIFSTSLSRRFQAAFPQWREHLGVNIEPTVCFHVDAQVNLCSAISNSVVQPGLSKTHGRKFSEIEIV